MSSSKPLATPVDADALLRFQVEIERAPFIAAPIATYDVSTRVLAVTMAVDTSNPENVWEAGFAAFVGAARSAGIPSVEWAGCRTWEGERGDYQREELVGMAEIGRRLHISRERVRQLSAGVFPHRVGRVGQYSVWRWGDVADWAAARGRWTDVPGRMRRLL